MGALFLSDLMLLLHLCFVIFVVFGGIATLYFRKVAYLHIPALVWGVILESSGFICPLTYLENWLRELGGRGPYPEGFIEHYLIPVIYPPGLTRATQAQLAVLLCVMNGAIYWRYFKKAPVDRKDEGHRGVNNIN